MIERHYTGFWPKHAIATTACGLLLFASLSACKDSDKTTAGPAVAQTAVTPQSGPGKLALDSLLTTLEGATSEVHEAMRPHTDAVQAKTKEEVNKLFRWEYKVVELPATSDAATLQARLSALGEENWEVIDMTTKDQISRITCKRRPNSAIGYLKYIPGL